MWCCESVVRVLWEYLIVRRSVLETTGFREPRALGLLSCICVAMSVVMGAWSIVLLWQLVDSVEYQ